MARHFDGNIQFLRNVNGILTAVPITMACWFRSDDLTIHQSLMALWQDGIFQQGFELAAGGSFAGDPVVAMTADALNFEWAESTAGYAANTWHHACGVWAAINDRRAYIDGGNRGNDGNNCTPVGIDETTIGVRPDAIYQYYMSGDIAEAVIWNVALTDGEVAALATGIEAWKIRPGNIVAYWPLWGYHSPEIDCHAGTYQLTLEWGPTQSNHAPVKLFMVYWPGTPGDLPEPLVPPVPPVPPVPITPTTPSLLQKTGLSLSVFKPTINTATTPAAYIPAGTWIEELRDQVNGWNHSILAMGGYDKARFTINDRQDRVERWLEEGLGNHIECYNHAQEEIWEGFVNKISVNLGPLSAVRGPLLTSPNRVSVVYSELDTQTTPPVRGESKKTTAANDTWAQGQYGIIEEIIAGGTATTVDAIQSRDTFLAENALPSTTQSVAGTGGPGVTIECLGYHHWLKSFVYNQIVNSGTESVDTKITAILNAELNTIINGNMNIIANALLVDRYENKDKTAWALIKALVALGDANSARYLFGIWEKRKAIYVAAPTMEVAYQQHLRDPARRVKTLSESIVMPWDVVPGKWIFFPDFLVGRKQDHQRRRDPRYMFIESTVFTAPWDVSLTGGKMDLAPQLMARLGLAGTGG